ncbi:hypothetical protein AKO1_002724, partial [Acrasis kona]
ITILSVTQRNSIITATLIVIIVTVFIQGTTVRWLVKLLKIELHNENPEEELKDLIDKKLDIKPEEFGINLKIEHLDLLLSRLKDITPHPCKNYEDQELKFGSHQFMRKSLSIIIMHVKNLHQRLYELNSRLDIGEETDLTTSEMRRIRAEKIRRNVYKSLQSTWGSNHLSKQSTKTRTIMQLIYQLYLEQSNKNFKNQSNIEIISNNIESHKNDILIQSMIKYQMLTRTEETTFFKSFNPSKKSLDLSIDQNNDLKSNVKVETLKSVELRMEENSPSVLSDTTSVSSTSSLTRLSTTIDRSNHPIPFISTSDQQQQPTFRKSFEIVKRSFERLPFIKYELSKWCFSEYFLYYILRLLHQDYYDLYIRSLQKAIDFELLYNSHMTSSWNDCIQLIQNLKLELIHYKNRKFDEIEHLQNNAFAQKVLFMCTGYISEASHLVAGVNYYDQSVAKRRLGARIALLFEKFIFYLDRINQFLVVRNFHQEELILIQALSMYQRYTLLDKRKNYHDDDDGDDDQIGDGNYNLRRNLIIKKQQQDALELVKKYQGHPLVNMNRILRGDRNNDRRFLIDALYDFDGMNQNQNIHHDESNGFDRNGGMDYSIPKFNHHHQMIGDGDANQISNLNLRRRTRRLGGHHERTNAIYGLERMENFDYNKSVDFESIVDLIDGDDEFDSITFAESKRELNFTCLLSSNDDDIDQEIVPDEVIVDM